MNAQQAFDRLIAAANLPVRMQRGGGIGDTLREDRGSLTTDPSGRGSVATQFRSTRPSPPTGGGGGGSDEEPTTLPVGSDPSQTAMTPVKAKNVPTFLTPAQLAKIRTRAGFQRFPGGKRPPDQDRAQKILDLQRRGFKFGNYADDRELFERMLENSGFAQKMGAGISGMFKEDGDRSIGRFVYDPRTEKIKGFESEAPGVGIAGLIAQALGGSLGEKPMVFTGSDDFDFLSANIPDPRDEDREPYGAIDPCPPGFVLKNGVCTPIEESVDEPDTPKGIPGFEMFEEGGIVQNLESIQDRAQEFSDFVSSKISGSGAANFMSTPSYPAGQMSSPVLLGGPQTVLGAFDRLSAEDAYAKAVEDARSQRAGGFMGRITLPGEMSFDEFADGYNRRLNNPTQVNLMNSPFNSLV